MTVEQSWWMVASGSDPAPVVKPAPDVRVARLEFFAGSERWAWRMTTDFALCYHVSIKRDLRPVLQQRRSAGYTGVRVLGAKAPSDNPAFPSLFVLDPRDPKIYAWTEELFTILRGEGFNCEFVIGVDEQIWKRTKQQQLDHFARMHEIASRHKHVVVENWNEPYKNMHGATLADFKQPANLAISSGSITDGVNEEDLMKQPLWTHLTYHNARDSEWPRKFNSNRELMDKFHRACISNEPIRCDGSEWPVSDWFEGGSCAGLFSPGATFHGAQGRTSDLWPTTVYERAVAFREGMDAVPLGVHAWADAKAVGGVGVVEENVLRAYGMTSGNQQWCIVVRPNIPQDGYYAPKTAHGWRVMKQYGPRGTVLHLEK